MQICVDVGNTTIRIGLFDNSDNFLNEITVNTDLNKSKDEYRDIIYSILINGKYNLDESHSLIFSSVVPNINEALKSALEDIFKCEIISVGVGTKTSLVMKVDNPYEVGSDLVIDMVGTKERYGYPAVIVDIGTATKILVLNDKGEFISCAIMPGIKLSLNALSTKAALLPQISLEKVKPIIEGKNTIECMTNGVLLGHKYAIIGLVDQIENELGYKVKRIITGGASYHIISQIPDNFIYDKYLNFEGLLYILKKNKKRD